jgi:hypothetical protein
MIGDLLPDEKFDKGDLFKQSGSKHTFEGALPLLDQYQWFRLFPMKVHADFAHVVLAEVEKRGGKEAAANWQRNLHADPCFD